MAINVVKKLTEAEIEELQRELDVVRTRHQEEFATLNDFHQDKVKEMAYNQKAELTEMYRSNPDLAFAVAAGLVRKRP